MIAPLPDLPPLPGMAQPTMAGIGTLPVPRFADLLIDALPPPIKAVPVRAERFNEDGFFAAAIGAQAAPLIPAPAPSAVLEDLRAPATAAAPATPITAVAAGAPVLPTAARTSAAASVPTSSRPTPTITTVVPAPPPATRPSREAPRPANAPPPRAPLRPRPPMPASFVTVAVQAVGQGIEIAATVAALDERDRAALSDEIAALLSAHGLTPARIVIAAPHRAPQDHR